MLVILPLQWQWGMELAIRTRFAVIRSALCADVQNMRAGRIPLSWPTEPIAQGDATSVTSPVAFIDDGLIDNWGGFVYDPASDPAATTTGGTASFRSAAGNDPMPLPFKDWFGGDMTSAMPLGGGWFYCWFT